MAWYTIEHSCGHKQDHQLYGPRRDREWRQKRLSEEICSECWDEERHRQNAEAAKANEDAGLPTLFGTDKQIAWAESIRARMISELDEVVRSSKNPVSELGQQIIDTIKAQDSARWWIDSRHDPIAYLINDVAKRLKSGKMSAPPREDDTEAAMLAKAEATVRPADPKTDTVTEIRTKGDVIEVIFPERNEEFRNLIRFELGYSWTGSLWRRKITGVSAPIEDRIVETAHNLLAAGFPIRVFDDELRLRAINGEFIPEPKRVVAKLTAGDYEGWFGISWPRKDDFYDVARRLPGSRWHKPRVVVPAEYFEHVEGFAEAYGFTLSPGAAELVESARLAKESELIAPPMAKNEAAAEKPGRIPRKLDVPEGVDIDDDLLDG